MAENLEGVADSITVDRKALDQNNFEALYRVSTECPRPPKETLTVAERVKRLVVEQCTCKELGKFWVRRFPCLDWIAHYDVKKDLLADIIAGFTIAIFQVPQGMAYAMLANVPPVYGLYTSFFPVLVYALMGTSKQASIGTFAIISLMTGVLVNRYSQSTSQGGGGHNETNTNETDGFFFVESDSTDDAEGLTAIQVATAVALVCGILQILFGVLRLGSLTVFLSEHLISGFTCGSAVHVLSSQIKTIFGVSLKEDDGGFLGLIYMYIEFFTVIHKSNLITLGLSGSTLLVLIFFKEFVNEKTKKITPVPFPIELLLVIASTLASSYLYLSQEHNVKIVGHIEQGFPSPTVPSLDTVTKVASGSIALAIVGFSSTVSLAKIFAAKYNYEIDPNQEMVALGTANIIGSIFSCVPSSASISRSSVQDGAGARTQLVSLINCAGLLVVLLALGSLLEPLPLCVLSCIIVISLKGMILLSKDFLKYWGQSKVDGAIWMITFVAVLLLDVDIGLIVGVGFALVTLIYRTVIAKTFLKGPLPNSELFAPLDSYQGAVDLSGVKVWSFAGPLHFANADYFLESIEEVVRLNDLKRASKRSKKSSKTAKNQVLNRSTLADSKSSVAPIIMEDCFADDFENSPSTIVSAKVNFLLVDCSAITYVDLGGLKALKTVFKNLDLFEIQIFMCSCPERVLTMLKKEDFFADRMASHFFPSLLDAVSRVASRGNLNEVDASQMSASVELSVDNHRDEEVYGTKEIPLSADNPAQSGDFDVI